MDFFKDEKMVEGLSGNGAFLTAYNGETINTMTINWFYTGQMWNERSVIVVVRPTRFTNEILENADSYTLSIPFQTMKEELRICGTKSGREFDKSAVVGFSKARKVNGFVVDGCDRYIECSISNVVQFDKKSLPTHIQDTVYKDGAPHIMYIGVVEAYY